MMWTLSEAIWQVARYTAGRAKGHYEQADAAFEAVGKDSRVDCTGQLFVALRGERFDGHDYVAQAREQGAAAAMVDHPLDLDIPQWVVPDTRLALGWLAGAWRSRFEGKVIAVTGSNGKTTCKEMIAAVLGQAGKVRATAGNLNNDIGMPLTLLAARDEDFLVLEMGANHAGEIAYLSDIGHPQIAVITNAGRAHLEGFGSLEGVARAKGEIALGLARDGTFIVPSDSPWSALWRGLSAEKRMLTCGPDAAADVRYLADQVSCIWDEGGFRTRFRVRIENTEHELELDLAGMHNVRNALVAVAVAWELGIGLDAIRAGLASLRPVPGRLDPRIGTDGVRLIDDSYNANPDSVLAAIEVLVDLPVRPPGHRWLVLGDLGELGGEAMVLHQGLGERAREAGVDRLYTVGALSSVASDAFGTGGKHFADQASLIDDLRGRLGPEDLVLVKGSRLAGMERVADMLCAEQKGNRGET